MTRKKASKAPTPKSTKPQLPGTVYRLTFEPRGSKPVPPLYINVDFSEPTAAIHTSDDGKTWQATRWTTQDRRSDNLRLVMLLINDIPEPRTTAEFHIKRGRKWLNLTDYNMPEDEARELEDRALAEPALKRRKK